MGLDINLQTSKIDISEEDGINVDLYTDKLDIEESEAEDIIIEITGLKSINKFIGLEDTPLYYENGKFFKVQDNKIIYTDIEWKDITGDIDEGSSLFKIIDSAIKAHDENPASHQYIQDIIQNNYNILDNKIDTVEDEITYNLNQEIQDRIDSDTALGLRIDGVISDIQAEATIRAENDTLLQNNIDDLSDDLDAEIGARETADLTLTNNLNQEIQDRIDGDNSLDDKIDSVEGALSDSITALDNKYDTITDALDDKIDSVEGALNTHISNKLNPHEVTKTQIGLGNVDNTSDLNKPISTATQNALDGKVPNTRTVNGKPLSSNISLDYTDVNALPDTTTINDLTTTAQQNALNSGITSSLVQQISTNQSDISDLTTIVSGNYTTLNNRITNEVGTLNTSISNEETARINADNNLQSQIDAITSASDVTDIVGTYAELQAYDTTSLPDKSIIKVLQDESRNDETTYYRWIITNDTGVWSLIGEEGPYYTKSEADSTFVTQTTTVNNKALSSNITLTASDVGALPDNTIIGNGTLTIQKNGITIDTFNANTTSNKTINISVPTDTSDLTNNAGFISGITSSDVTNALGYTPENINNKVTSLSSSSTDTQYPSAKLVYDELNDKQETLVSGTNIKTVNNESLLGSGNIDTSVIPPIAYGTSTTAAATVQKEVSIPSITELRTGQVIVVQPTITSTVANSTIKLNNFDPYPMRYNNAAITTSSDSVVWSANFPSTFVFNGEYWVFTAHGLDTNTTYTINYSIDAGAYKSGTGSYAISRYSLCMQKPDMTWEKVTATNANYSTGTTKSVNTSGFLLGNIRYYSTTATKANGAYTDTNVMYEKAAKLDLRYSTNCGDTPSWTAGDYIYFVGTMGVDGLFYLDTTTWWTNTLPSTNDGKLYVQLGKFLSESSISLYENHPAYYYDGTKLCEYKIADNKQDTISDLSTIRSNATNGQSAYTTIGGYGNIVTHNTSEFATSAQGSLADTALQPNDNISLLNNNAGYITSSALTGYATENFVTSQGYITSSALSPYVLASSLATVATSGSYADLSNKPTIPTVGNGTITINQGGIQKGTFTLNQSGNATINLDAGGGTVDQTFDGTSANAQSGVAIEGELSTNYVKSSAENTSQGITSSIGYVDGLAPSLQLNWGTYQFNVVCGEGAALQSIDTSTNNAVAIGAVPQGVMLFQNSQQALLTLSSNSNLVINGNEVATLNDIPTNISDLTDDTATNPVDKADTLTGLTATVSELNYTDGVTSNIQTQFDTITGKIPSQASTSNQLADKAFVNSSVQTATANFRGNWDTWALVPTSASSYPTDYTGSTTPTVNDYLVVQDASDYTGDTLEGTWRFKYTGTWSTDGKSGWNPEYQVNETPLTSAQLAALNSGITSGDVTLIGTALQPSDITNMVTTNTDQNITGTKTFVGQKRIGFKQSGTSDKLGFTLYNSSGTEKGYLEFNPSNLVDSVPLMTLGNYASSASSLTHVGFRKYSSISGASGAYNLLAPLISDAKTPFNLTTTYTNFYLPLGFTDGNTTVLTAKSGLVDISSLLPTVPTNISSFTNDSGYITSSALSPYVLASSLATVATSGSYNDLSNKPTIPTVDQTFDSTSANAQSGVAIYGALTDGSISPTFGDSIDISSANLYFDSDNYVLYSSAKTDFPEISINSNYDFKTEINAETGENELLIYSNITDDNIWFSSEGGILIDTSSSGGQLQYNGNQVATQTWVGNQGYLTGITSGDVTTALGYTPYNSSNPNGYTSNVGTVTSVNNVSPVNGNVTLSIPTATDVQINGTSITSSSVANILTNTAYNASSNKIATMSDLPSVTNLANKDLSNLSATGEAHFQAPISDLATIRSGASAGATAVQPATLNNYVAKSEVWYDSTTSTLYIGVAQS